MRAARRVGWQALLIASLSTFLTSPLRGQPVEPKATKAIAADAQLVSVLKSASGAPILVGASGQLYRPIGGGTWQRQHAGGVSVEVLNVVRSAQGVLFAIGTRTPLFELDTDRWSSYAFEKRGEMQSSQGDSAIFSVGRTIFQLGASGFRKIGSAKGNVEAIWASTGSRLFVLTDGKRLWTGNGNSWRGISLNLGKDESIASLHGVPGQAAVARTSLGRLFRLEGKKASEVTVSPDLIGLQIHVIAAAAGKLYVAGVRRTAAGPVSLLAEVGNDGLRMASVLWPLAPGDRFAIVSGYGNAQLLVATRTGQLRLRNPQGHWLPGLVDLQPPKGPAVQAERAPALTR